jgi:hypothetical protein
MRRLHQPVARRPVAGRNPKVIPHLTFGMRALTANRILRLLA